MKKLTPIIALFFMLTFVVSQNSTAQDNAEVLVTANVVEPLVVLDDGDLSFGQVVQNTTSTVNQGDTNAGRVTIQGTATAQVLTTISFPAQLIDGPNTLDIDNRAVHLNGSNLNNIVDPGFTLTGNDLLEFTGAVSPDDTTPAGTYEATIEVTVQYL